MRRPRYSAGDKAILRQLQVWREHVQKQLTRLDADYAFIVKTLKAGKRAK